MDSTPQSRPSDAVDHLRTVHFALITVSTVLLILISGTKDLPIEKARTQATEILELTNRWNDVTREAAEQALRRAGKPEEHVLAVRVPPRPFPPLRKGFGGYIQVGPNEFAKEVAEYGGIMAKPPGTLAAFRSWWDTLARGYTQFMPDLSAEATDCTAWVSEPRRDRGLEEAHPLDCDILKNADGSDRVPPEFRPIPAEWANSRAGIFNYLNGKISVDETGRTVEGVGNSNSVRFYVRVSYPVFQASYDETFLQNVFSDWRTGTFAQAFWELASVSGDVQYVELDHVLERMRELPAKDQTVEVVGLKIPAARVNSWGLFLLVAFQLYFWLHLHELTRRIDACARDVAWIAVYESWLARLVTLMSACVLPLVATTWLAYRFQAAEGNHRWMLVVLASILWGGSALLVVATLSGLRRLHSQPTTRSDALQ